VGDWIHLAQDRGPVADFGRNGGENSGFGSRHSLSYALPKLHRDVQLNAGAQTAAGYRTEIVGVLRSVRPFTVQDTEFMSKLTKM
jgi:hypothetical protein